MMGFMLKRFQTNADGSFGYSAAGGRAACERTHRLTTMTSFKGVSDHIYMPIIYMYIQLHA